jgi:putative hydrolase of the HAD superfamily
MRTLVQRTRGADVEAVIRPEASVAISQAKSAGCKLAILSNELDLFYGSDFRLRLSLLAEFEVIVDATYTGVLKPDPRAYEECLVKLEVEASRAVFVDDQLRNVEGARRSGLEVVHFDVRDPISSYNKAMQLLGLNSINRW